MADTPFPRFRIRRITLVGGDAKTYVHAPIACNYVSWRNLGDLPVSVLTSPYDDESYDTLGAGAQGLIVTPPSGPVPELGPRFSVDQTVFCLKLDDTDPNHSSTVVVQFVF